MELNFCEEQVESTPGEASHDGEAKSTVKKIIRALLFASDEPLSLQRIRDVTDEAFPYRPKELQEILLEIRKDLEKDDVVQLDEIAQGYVLRTKKDYAPFVARLLSNRRPDKLSQAALEVLAIVAFKSPITRAQIERIRGVDCSGTVQNLLERGLIEVSGRLDAPGRPSLLSTTKQFLKHFGLRDLTQLPGNK